MAGVAIDTVEDMKVRTVTTISFFSFFFDANETSGCAVAR
jgi:hypothetical protein